MVVIVGAVWTLIVGCHGSAGLATKEVSPPYPVLGMLNKGIIQLTVNIDNLNKRMAELEQAEGAMDPTLRELRALDLSGWRLHQQSWLLQREHLEFAKERLLEARKNVHEKARVLEAWTEHEQRYERALDDLRQERLGLEKQRLQAEARLIEQSLR
jgi:hypothetical protein